MVVATVKRRVIETGRIFDILVQGENRAHTIAFAIPNESLDVSGVTVALKDCYFYLLYKRKGDPQTQIPISLTKTYDSSADTISASFEPTSYFTEKDGGIDIQIIACSTSQDFVNEDVDIDDVALWSTMNAQIYVSTSQLANSQSIVAEDMFTKGITEMSAYRSSAETFASDAEEFAKGTRSDGGTVTHATDNSKYYKEQTKTYYDKVVSLETDIVALYNDKTNLDAVAADLTNIDTVATNISDVSSVADDITNVVAVANDLTNIDSVEDDLTNIDTVAAKVSEVATVAGSISNVNTVAGSISNVNTVAGDKTNIDTVAGDKTNIDTVAGNKTNIDTVAGISSSVSTVAGISSAVSSVSSISSDVSAVAGIASDVSAVEDISSDVTTVATNISDVSAVANDITKVASVADDLTNIDAVADDLTNIDAAPTYAALAADWAEKDTAVETGKYSAKYWAGQASSVVTGKEDASNKVTSISGSSTDTQYPSAKCVYTETSTLKDALTTYASKTDARIKNLEQKAGDYGTWHYPNDPDHSSDMPNKVPTGKAKYGLVKSIVGKTRAWNQMVENGNFDGSAYWAYDGASFTQSGNKGIIVGDSNYANIYKTSFPLISGHTYLAFGTAKASASITIKLYFGTSSRVNFDSKTVTANTTTFFVGIGTYTTEDKVLQFGCESGAGGATVEFSNVAIRDLTPIFPEGVPSTVAECVQKCPDILKYDAYGQSIVDTTVEGVESRGFNLWDEEWEVGSISASTGANEVNASEIRSKNYIDVSPLGTYYIKCSAPTIVLCYDANHGFIDWVNFGPSNTTFQTKEGTKYIRFCTFNNVYGNTYNHDICINISGSLNGTYKPYVEPSTLSLPTPVTLRSAGSVADKLDIESGVKTRRIGSYTFTGAEIWSYHASEGPNDTNRGACVLSNYFSDECKTFSADEVANAIIAGYIAVNQTRSVASPPTTTAVFAIYKTGIDIVLVVCDISCDSDSDYAQTFAGKTIIYELATPTTESIDPVPDNTLYTEGGGTVNTIQTQSPVIDNCLDVGYLAV